MKAFKVSKNVTVQCLCMLLLGTLHDAHADGIQSVRTEPIIISAEVGDQIPLNLFYSTAPDASELTGLGLRMHWDSSALTLNLPASFSIFLEIASSPQPDTLDFDLNPNTDRFIVLFAADQDAAWPGFNEGFIASTRFILQQGFSSFTTVGFSASSTPVGWTFSDLPTTIVDSDTDVPPPLLGINKRWLLPPDGSPGIQLGDDAFFEIEVVNDGIIGIDDLSVDDPLSPDCDRDDIPRLLAGESFTYQCSEPGVFASFVNEATVVGVGLDNQPGTPVSATASATVTVLDPLLDLVVSPETQTVQVGDTATFDVAVMNTSDETISGIEIASDTVPDCNISLDPLSPGESLGYACSIVATDSFTNTMSVTALTGAPLERRQLDLEMVDVRAVEPSVSIVKEANPQSVEIGGDVEFDFVVTNNGDIELTNVQIDDPILESCNRTFTGLEPGASVEWSCMLTDLQDDITNIATVTATPLVGDVVVQSASATVTAFVLVFRDDFE